MEFFSEGPMPNSYSGAVLSAIATFILVVVFKKRSELTWHALSNMCASLIVTALNLAMVWLFVLGQAQELLRFVQSVQGILSFLSRDLTVTKNHVEASSLSSRCTPLPSQSISLRLPLGGILSPSRQTTSSETPRTL